jgi:multidrug transporter EmrE-like cation transporter
MEHLERRSMLPFLLILLVSISLGTTGQILLKSGLQQLPGNAPISVVLLSVVQNLRVFLGFACYGVSSLVYLIALKRLPLSYAYPMVALSYVLVVGLSWKLLGEAVPPLRFAAVGVILTGVLLLALSYDGAARRDGGAAGTAAAAGHTTPGDPGAAAP